MSDVASRIYISTGGVRDHVATRTARLLADVPYGVELSGGTYLGDIADEVAELAAARPAHVLLHNYFPVPAEPFVLDLATRDAESASMSLALCEEALRLSAVAGATHYAVHAGYLVDADVRHLGHTFPRSALRPRGDSLELMRERLLLLAAVADEVGVRLLVENHALAPFNLDSVGADFLLLTHPDEIGTFIESMSGRVGLLLDVGHLHATATALSFDAVQAASDLASLAEGYHVSANDGQSDAHAPLGPDEWFFPVLNPASAFYTVEIHDAEVESWIRSADLLSRALT